MPFDKLVNSNQIITSSWCNNITTPFCPVDCGDIFQIIRTSWHHRQVPTFIAMLILVASFIHFILYFPPLILKCLLKSSHDSANFKSECQSVRLSAEILQQNASTPLSNRSNNKPEQKSNTFKRAEEKSRQLSNELENKALKISAAADALFKSTCLTYINSTCVLDTPGKKTNSHDSKNFNSLILNNSKVNNAEKSLNISLLISQAIENMSFEPKKPVKNWHPEVKTNRREHMVHELIRALLPKFHVESWIRVDQNDDTISFGEELHPVEILARQEESEVYEMADSKTQYFNRIYSLIQQIHDNKFIIST